MKRKIFFLDTTLRDGNKLPFIVMNLKDRLEIAHKLNELGVDIIDAGYPFASDRDREAVSLISKEVKRPYISALTRAIPEDIDFTLKTLSAAERRYLHIFMPISDQFIDEVLKKTRDEVLRMVKDSVSYAKTSGSRVQFSFSEFPHADEKFLFDAIDVACSSGVDTISLADTNGVMFPFQVDTLIEKVYSYILQKGYKTVLGVHFHNDLGVATANTLTAIKNGASHVEVTIGGLGARSGNTALEEVAIGIELLGEELEIEHSLRMEKVDQTALLISHLTGIMSHPNKPIIGRCAFREPEGSRSRDSLSGKFKTILNEKHIGRESDEIFSRYTMEMNEFKKTLKSQGISYDDLDMEDLYSTYRYYMEKRGYIRNSELRLIVEDMKAQNFQKYILGSFGVMTGSSTLPVGIVELWNGEQRIVQSADGTGPVDALCRAVDRAVGLSPKLIMYTVDTVSEGKDARAEVTVTVELKGRRFHGHYGSTDVIEASLVAYLNAVNRIISSGITETEKTFYVNGDTLWE